MITTNLPDSIAKAKHADKYCRYFVSDIDDLLDLDVDGIDKMKESNLVVISHLNCEDKVFKDKVIEFFSKKFNFTVPYCLIISDKSMSPDEEFDVYSKENYYFVYDETSDKYNELLHLFVRSVFSKLKYITRINSYIVDAFQTIINAQIIEDQKNEIIKLNNELNKLSKTDYLTNVLNRRAFFDILESERKRTYRNYWRMCNTEKIDLTDMDTNAEVKFVDRRPKGNFFEHYGTFSCIILDIDHFKDVNDNYGHLKGDEVLSRIGVILRDKDIFRENDTVARYGGEEFVIILPETNYKHAKIPAERLRKIIKKQVFIDNCGENFYVTISAGISQFKLSDKDNLEIVNRADKALYYAKEHGRDQIAVYEEVFKEDA